MPRARTSTPAISLTGMRLIRYGIPVLLLLLIGMIAVISANSTTIGGLTSQVSQLTTSLDSLRTAFNSLSTAITQLEAPQILGAFNYTITGCTPNCTYQITGAYANVGTNPATGLPNSVTSPPCPGSTSQTLCTGSVLLRFTLYANPDKTGAILCQSPYYVLGQINGRTLQSWSSKCQSNSTVQARSLSYQIISS